MAGKGFVMQIRQWKIEKVKPYERNPRRNDEAVNKVAASIQEFGFRQPIVVDSDGVIVVGHTRYKAALKLGLEKVPVHVASELTPEKIKAYRIIDNKTNEIAEWDAELLEVELDELVEAEYSFDDLGFDMELDFFEEEKGDDERDDVSDQKQNDGVNLEEKFIVEIECSSELEQNEVFTSMTRDGYKCRVLKL